MLRDTLDKINHILQKCLIGVLRVYQFFLSPLLGQRCRFHPSCSQYAIETLTQHNVLKSIYLILHRLLRCQPLHPGGYDPVMKDPNVIEPN